MIWCDLQALRQATTMAVRAISAGCTLTHPIMLSLGRHYLGGASCQVHAIAASG